MSGAAKLADLVPGCQERVIELMTLCTAEGFEVAVTSGFRLFAEQAALFAQGRNAVGRRLPGGRVVTNAMPGQSFHNVRRAADLVLDDKPGSGVKPEWNPADPRWKTMGRLARTVGLAWGGTFKSFPDLPHVEWRWCAACTRDHPRATAFREDGSCQTEAVHVG